MTTTRPPTAAGTEQVHALLDALLYSVSHDLRSPLLTMALSAELLDDVGADPDAPATLAVQAMRESAAELERMLQAITLLSRARRRPLSDQPVALRMLLGGHEIVDGPPGADAVEVAVDALVVREWLDAMAAAESAPLRLSIDGTDAVLRIPLAAAALAGIEGSPAQTLAEALRTYAGSALEVLAVTEVLLGRQGGALTLECGESIAWLPLAPRSARQ